MSTIDLSGIFSGNQMQPTLLHTLNADVQGLLSERLLENTLDQLKQYPVYFLEYRVSGVVKESSLVCLGADQKASIFKIITDLLPETSDYCGFHKAFEHNHIHHHPEPSFIVSLYEKRPGLKDKLRRVAAKLGVNLTTCGLYHPEQHLLQMLLFRWPLINIRWGMDVTNMEYQTHCLLNGHKILGKYLKVEDLIEFLNVHDNSDCVVFRPLQLQLCYY